MTRGYDPSDDGPETASYLVDNHAKALKTVLREMTSIYAEDNEMVPVQFGSRAAADADGKFVAIDPSFPDRVDVDVSGPQILRVLDDTVSHEVAHLNWSDLKSKEAFANEYGGWGYVPGIIINVLEDAYIDHRRTQRWYGLRSKMAYTTWLAMQDDDVQPPVDLTIQDDGVADVKAYVDALSQLSCAGYVKYDAAIPPGIAEWLVDVEPLLKRVRTQDDPERRYTIAHAAMALLKRHVDVPDRHGDSIVPEGLIAADVPTAPGSSGGPAAAADGAADAEPADSDVKNDVEKIVDEIDAAGGENVDVDRDANEITMKTRGVTRDDHAPDVVKRVDVLIGGRDPGGFRVVNDDG